MFHHAEHNFVKLRLHQDFPFLLRDLDWQIAIVVNYKIVGLTKRQSEFSNYVSVTSLNVNKLLGIENTKKFHGYFFRQSCNLSFNYMFM